MQEFMTFITPVLQDLLYILIIGVVTVLSRYVISFIQSKRDSIKTETDLNVFNNTLGDTLNLVQNIVDTVSQTYVNSLKASGNFTPEAQEKAFNMALDNAKKMIGEGAQEILTTAYGDLDAWLKVQIESYILAKKEK